MDLRFSLQSNITKKAVEKNKNVRRKMKVIFSSLHQK